MALYHLCKRKTKCGGLVGFSGLLFEDENFDDKVLSKFPSKIGWGHSTWEEGVRLCREVGVKRLGIFHHDPEHDDKFMDGIAKEAAKKWSGTFVIQENMDFLVE